MAFAVPLCLGATVPLLGQCPDGTPPPCSGARALDPQRIAILPFHVMTADTLLGEGLAELLALEFNGEGVPRAAHLGTVLRAWRAAGGSARAPLTQARAARVARTVGAGQYVEASVVGLGSRLTLSAQVRRQPGGNARAVGPFSGPADSLEALVGQLAAGLVAASGSERQVDTRSRLTGSPVAMRAYLAGLREFRRARFGPALREFDRALVLDSLFARAALIGRQAATWAYVELEPYDQRVWALRTRLSSQDRVLLTSFLGDRYPAERSPAENLADRERAAAQLPESPEAFYELGDYLYHFGAANGIPDQLARARAALERSVALDPQATVLLHLVGIGVYLADTALMRNAARGLAALGANPEWQWVAAALTGDQARATSLVGDIDGDGLREIGWGLGGKVPADLLTALYQARPAADAAERARLGYALQFGLVVRGRQASLPYIPASSIVSSALFADGDWAAGVAAASRLTSDTLPWAQTTACMRAHWLVRTGGAVSRDLLEFLRARNGLCAVFVELLLASRDGAPDMEARLVAADSTVRHYLANVLDVFGYEDLVLARLWAERGDTARALASLRLIRYGFCCHWTAATGAREEGQLAALQGDTARAINAYRRYLDLRRDARPELVPQRDSVLAELTRLERR